ncbi:UNKNOWN [Stylonychia lemnae]|uniref:Uncharacterized protein n=1 Tax=Stylonychia lemnae TaxID=5949 RepID=A0A078B4Q4_STYLE|nr:UNKNOWN [Stylonychia lemnae]|eukprot:CDW89404.1 UNKNOWN [Stylonychia lemnae]
MYSLPYEKDIQEILGRALQIQDQIKSQPSSQAKKVKEIDVLLQKAHSYILQFQLDQKSMPPSQKKKDARVKLSEYNAKYHQIEVKQQQLKLLVMTDDEDDDSDDCGMQFDDKFKKNCEISEDEEEQRNLIKTRKKNKKILDKTKNELDNQNSMLSDSIKSGLSSLNLARGAMLALRGQRDQIVNTVGIVREIGFDLMRSEKTIKDINKRKLINIIILYLIIFLLFVTIILVLYFKVHF